MAGKKFPAIISMLLVQNLFMRLLPDGNRMVGQCVKVEQARFFQNRDYRVFDRLKAMFAGLFGRIFGLETAGIQRILAGVRPVELGLV